MAYKNQDISLSDRYKEVLRAVIGTYVDTAEPVGSRTIAKKSGLGLSPATIRNVMADLEEMGLLVQPHISAGRVPTESGLRYFVDCLLEKEPLSWGDQVAIEQTIKSEEADLVALLKRAVELLADFSGHAALITTPVPSKASLHHIDFVLIKPGLVLVVAVTGSGLMQQRLVNVSPDLDQEFMDNMAAYFNEKLKEVGFKQAKEAVAKELEKEKKILEQFLTNLVDDTAAETISTELIVGGELNLLDYPEFASISRARAVLQKLKEKHVLLTLLDQCVQEDGTKVIIGSEGLGHEVECGLVIAPYRAGEETLGSLGVMGPMRMNYARALALVEYTAEVLSEWVKEMEK